MKEPFEAYKKDTARLYFLAFVFGVLFLVLISGLGWRQLIQGNQYRRQEKLQSMRRIVQPGPRGNIYDRKGRLLVGNRPVFYAAIYLGEIRREFRNEYFLRVRRARERGEQIDRARFRQEARVMVVQSYLNKVNRILGRNEKVDERSLERHFQQRMLLPMPLINDLEPEEYARLVDQLPVESPIQVLTDSARFYPYGSCAAHLIGYVSSTDDIPDDSVPGKELTTFTFKGKVGKTGLEKRFNEALQGISSGEVWLVDPVGFQFQRVAEKSPEQGQSLTISIDAELQRVSENAMGEHIGAVVLLDIKSGEILALVSKPDYDLNDLTPFISNKIYSEISKKAGWFNRALYGLYPPASPFKLITSMSLLRHNVLDPYEIVNCGPSYKVGNRIFKENNHLGHGDVDLKRAIQVSSNVYFYNASLNIDPFNLASEARLFGFDQPINFELTTTNQMIVPDPAWKKKKIGERWRGGDTTNMCIGQGFLRVTPMHMACFAAALARRETRFHPTVLHSSQNKAQALPTDPKLNLTDEAYELIIQGMEAAAENGSARYVKVPGVSVAAKTGTGQIRYKGKRLTTPWVMGFAPIEDPQIAFAVLVEGTKDASLWGSTTAGSIAHNILAAYFQE